MIYFKDVLTKYATTPTAREAALRLVESYKAIQYKDDAAELCAQLRAAVSERPRRCGDVCQGVPNVAAAEAGLHPGSAASSRLRPRRPDRVRIGLLGGSFDPPHTGHLLAAGDAFEALSLDRVVFIPTAIQPLKAGQHATAAEQRLRDDPTARRGRCAVRRSSAIEIERGGLSYTVDTLAALADRWPGAELFWLVGADVTPTFAKWREPERIVELATVVVLQRTGEATEPGGDAGDDPRCCRRGASTSRRPRFGSAFAKGKSIRGFVPDAVADFIAAERLYR